MALNVLTTRLLVTVPCDECQGAGSVYDPENFGWAHANQLDGDAYEQWYAERMGELDLKIEPPEEGPCRECEGSGRREREVALTEVLEVLSVRAA
jgi:DnaJ-class molecular chaperone